MKKRIDVLAQRESYYNLSTFSNVEELNKTVRIYRDVIKTSIKRIDVQSKLISLLEILKRHSCKYVGVSFLCKNRIAEIMGVSYKTVQRLTTKLVTLRMIKQVAMKRKKDMRQTSNAIIIQPFINEVSHKHPAETTKKCPTVKTTTKILKQKNKDINKRNGNDNNTVSKDNIKCADFVAHWVPKRFASLTSAFYSKAKTIQEFWKVVKQCNRVVDHTTGRTAFDKEQEIMIGVQAMKEFAMKVKNGVNMKKGKFAYFNGIVNNLMDKYYFDPEFGM
ncbi:helix-turn-helix domain-containing protein [Bacillus thuringiensis]|uniref:Cytosolic protein n=1 Tax=Bacillus thuringiensis TaxID=1428 RepID=A0A9W3TG21_BACTU|nr:cytosolic protein [Bacillus thuringiensis]AQY39376.1 cytosolic protein [Bacillus thuringiensis]MDR4146020.1 helix-turn-helix domain-containing protein [Bacillus thuringiensis]MEC3575219.1 helix-turn-helix domain-containing protein [Bacillus thuringiensis]MED2021510.1 helix-turn-helix domain-containing protein [Bacillus thuringiensis]MED2143105.1 helix-turn-helix domain-containing protein [Bacillus thuringiensis]